VNSDIQQQLNALPTSVNFANINSEIDLIQSTLTNMLYVDNTTVFNSPLFYVNGNMTLIGNLNGISPTIINFLSGVSSNIQNQLDNIRNSTASNENFTSMNASISSIQSTLTNIFYNSTTNTTEFNDNVIVTGTLNGVSNSVYAYLANVTSDIQFAIDHAYTTISIGSVSSLSYGQTPTVTNTGTEKTAILNFGIPTGQSITGPAGIDGIDAIQPTFTIGTVASTNYGNNPTVSLTGTQTAPILNFVLETGPAGQRGNDGNNGRDGNDGRDGNNGRDGDSFCECCRCGG
jgi:hypothetical protein